MTARIEWPELRALIAARIPQPVIARLAPIPPAELKHLRPKLKALRTELRRELFSGDMVRYDRAFDQLAPLYLAGIMSSESPAEALDWLTSSRLRDASWCLENGGSTNPDQREVLRLLLLDHRDTAWQRELAVRLANWLPDRGDARRWKLLEGLILWSGAVVPATDGYIVGWVREAGHAGHYGASGGSGPWSWLAELGSHLSIPHHTTLLERLRAEPRLAEFVRRMFEVADIGAALAAGHTARFGPDNEWPKALTKLADEGVLDRGELLDLCTAKLLRGDRPGNLRGFVRLHEELAPTLDEVADRRKTYIGIVVGGAGTVAKIAQAALRDLDNAGRLETDALLDIAAAVLVRPEKNLATAQLAWLDAAARRDPATAGPLMRVAATAFTHPGGNVQERAVRLIVKHATNIDSAILAELREAAGDLNAALRDEARRALGVKVSSSGSGLQVSPQPGYQPRAMPPPIASAVELAERFVPALAGRAVDPLDAERIMEAVVVEHHRDPQALVEALSPLARRYPPEGLEGWEQRGVPKALRCVFDAVLGLDTRDRQVMYELYRGNNDRPPAPEWATLYRTHELIKYLVKGDTRIPCLLATPTAGNGDIDPAVLVQRLDAYAKSSAAPLPWDLEQALIRVPIGTAREIVETHPVITGHPGTTFVAGLRLGSLRFPTFDGFVVRGDGGAEKFGEHPKASMPTQWILPSFTPASEHVGALPYKVLTETPDPFQKQPYAWDWTGPGAPSAYWPSLLPHHPEIVAAHAIPDLYEQATDTLRNINPVLPLLAETAGRPGPVVHLAVAYGLAAGRPENRVAAVDAIYTLAARTLLDTKRLGVLLGALGMGNVIKMNRLVASLTEAARGLPREVLGVVASMLPALADQPSMRGLPDLLALGSECAAATGGTLRIPELDGLAALRRPARVAREAERLRHILSGTAQGE
ncbi:hypothetical protein Acsp03_00530 [Actinomadura sp. NBRC 104412]|uniref:DUF7824 domain-containing protein n=1 Tax=Actinomadura sp. NBRC 104412 TaxID=3032203 RepID=UPI0024A315BA|nr:DUF6493 family protein [Actinomadura sp. NBRC 104412]GLZ02586.1 hypothetical protein Acsp03_00530 [Actinomadura sp. NBRC 104412]